MRVLSYATFANALREIDGFAQISDDHIANYDEVLQHVLLGDFTRFLMREARARGTDSARLREGIQLLEDALHSSDEKLQELVVLSFLENVDKHSSFGLIRSLFGAELERNYQIMLEDLGRLAANLTNGGQAIWRVGNEA